MYNLIAFAVLILMCLYILFWWICTTRIKRWQKTRGEAQQPRMFVSSVANRTSLSHAHQPAIYITPVNMPPPKYEVLAPPSYEEVVGIHYPATLAIVTPSSHLHNAPPPGADPSPSPATVQSTPATVQSTPATVQSTPATIQSAPATTQCALATPQYAPVTAQCALAPNTPHTSGHRDESVVTVQAS